MVLEARNNIVNNGKKLPPRQTMLAQLVNAVFPGGIQADDILPSSTPTPSPVNASTSTEGVGSGTARVPMVIPQFFLVNSFYSCRPANTYNLPPRFLCKTQDNPTAPSSEILPSPDRDWRTFREMVNWKKALAVAVRVLRHFHVGR